MNIITNCSQCPYFSETLGTGPACSKGVKSNDIIQAYFKNKIPDACPMTNQTETSTYAWATNR